MSSAGINSINSGPLIIRTYLDNSVNNTYILGSYDYPISANRILITSTNGLVAPSDNITISTINVSTIKANYILVSSLVASTITSENIYTTNLITSTIESENIYALSILASTIDSENIYTLNLIASTISTTSIRDRDGFLGNNNDVLKTDGNTVYWAPDATGTSFWTLNGIDIYNNNSGNVGINTTTPQYNLDVNGSTRIASSLTVSSISSVNNIDMVNGQNIGPINNIFTVNTLVSTAQFQVLYDNELAPFKGINGNFIYTNPNKDGYINLGAFSTGTQSALPLCFQVASNGVATNGFVGINTNSPKTQLDVNGNTNISGGLTVVGSISTFGAFVISSIGSQAAMRMITSGNGNSYIESGSNLSNASANKLLFTNINAQVPTNVAPLAIDMVNYRIGVNTDTPKYTLDVIGYGHFSTTGGVILFEPDGTNGNVIRYGGGGPNANNLIFQGSQNIEKMRITPLGNVGIGTTNPSQLLDVNGNVNVSGSIVALGNITAASDIRYKSNIKTIENALSTIKNLRGVSFITNNNQTKNIGVIAQEIEQILPEVVLTDNTPNMFKSVAYGNMVGLLIEAIKELSYKINHLENKINSK